MRLIRTVGDTGISVRNDEGTGALRIFRDKEEFMKKGQTAAAILLLSLALNGCGGGNGTTAFAPTETSLYVTKDEPLPAQMWRLTRMITTVLMN